MSDSVKCAACPNAVFPSIEAYRAHNKTKWHSFNNEQRMMGRQTLTEEEYNAKMGGNGASGGGAQPKKEEPSKVEPPPPDPNEGKVTVCVVFELETERWSRKFMIERGTTVMELKKSMIKPQSPPEDVVSFNLKRGMIRMTHFDTIDGDETFNFHFCGVEDGQKMLDKDESRQKRDEEELKAREHAREQEEERRQEDEKRRAEEKRKKEEEQKRQEEEQERRREEDETRRKDEAEQKRREDEERKKREEEARKQREEEVRRHFEEKRRQREEEAKRKQEEEEEERRRRQEERRKAEEKEAGGPAGGPAGGHELTVYIDKDLGLKTSIAVREGMTCFSVKEHLASVDPTGLAKPEDFALVEPTFGRELHDSELITAALKELHVAS